MDELAINAHTALQVVTKHLDKQLKIATAIRFPEQDWENSPHRNITTFDERSLYDPYYDDCHYDDEDDIPENHSPSPVSKLKTKLIVATFGKYYFDSIDVEKTYASIKKEQQIKDTQKISAFIEPMGLKLQLLQIPVSAGKNKWALEDFGIFLFKEHAVYGAPFSLILDTWGDVYDNLVECIASNSITASVVPELHIKEKAKKKSKKAIEAEENRLIDDFFDSTDEA